MSDAAAPPPARPLRKALRILGAVLSFCIVMCIVLAIGGVLYLKGKPFAAPEWVQDRIEARIAEVLPEADVSFGQLVFVVEEGWRPQVRLRNVVVRTNTGVEVVRFNEFSAAFAARPLLEGQVQPRRITLSGIVARLRRDADGTVTLSGGVNTTAPTQSAATLPELVGQLDAVLERPALRALRSVDLRALTLQYDDVRSQRGWTVDGARVRVEREAGDLTVSADLAVLSGGTGVATLAANYSSTIGQTAAEFGVSFEGVAARDIAAQGPAFAWLDVLRAPISGAVRSGLTEAGRFTPLNATLQIGAGAVQPNAATQPIPFDGARSYFSYIPEEKLLRFDELSVTSKWLTGQANGTAVLGVDAEQGALTDLIGQINLNNLKANPLDLYPDPVTLAGAETDFRLELNPFRVTFGRVQISDQGNTLLVDGSVAADDDGWRVALDGRMDELDTDRLLALWPTRAVPRTRKWLAENLQDGDVHDLDIALRRTPNAPPQTYLAFDFSDASIRFMKTLPPITKGKGHFSLAKSRLVISVDEGQVVPPEGGPIQMQGSSFIIPDVRVKEGAPSVVRLETASSITAALSLLNHPPLSVMDKAKLPVVLADGRAQMSGTLAFPLKPAKEKPKVTYHVAGELRALGSDVLVKDRNLTARKLDLRADNSELVLSGEGEIDGVAFDGSWTQPIGPDAGASALRGQVALNDAALKTFGVTLPQGSLNGTGTGRIALDFKRGTPPRFTLGSDLRGIGISVPQVSWSKSRAQAGQLRVDGTLGPQPVISRLEVSGPGLSANGRVDLDTGGGLERLRFDQLRVGDWLDVPVDLVGRGAGNPVQVVLRGGSLDLRRAEFGAAQPQQGPAPPPMQLRLNRLQVTGTIALTDIQGEFDIAKGLDGAFEARLNGATAVTGRVIPQNGRSAVRLTSTDAGGVLRSAGLLRQVVGGTLSLMLLPVGSGGAFDGRLTIGDVRIKDAPGIAALLNAVSVVGLVNELNGDGIYFNDVEGTFRLTPNRLTLTEGSAVGASMGLSMDGTYALDSGQIGMQGVITPVYLLNGIGSVLTRKGEGLIGFNYTLSGEAKKPSVSVNPLSALTPGMFREIFRTPPPDLPAVDGITDSTLPPSAPAPTRPVARTYEGR